MWFLLWGGCRDPILVEIDGVALPAVAAVVAVGAVPVVAVTKGEILLDPTPWRDLLPDARPSRVLSLATPQEHAFALPALVAAMEPLRDAAVAADRRPVIAVAADATLPYRAVVRVLFSLGMAQISEVELRVLTPAGPASVPLRFPGYCGPSSAGRPVGERPLEAVAEAEERLLALLGSSKAPCVAPSITEVPAGLKVVLDEQVGGCFAFKVRDLDASPTPTPSTTDWRGAVVVPTPGACPSVAGRDAVALDALLDRAGTLGPPCATATLALRDETPWGEAVKLLARVQERHEDALFAVDQEARPDCGRTFVLAP